MHLISSIKNCHDSKCVVTDPLKVNPGNVFEQEANDCFQFGAIWRQRYLSSTYLRLKYCVSMKYGFISILLLCIAVGSATAQAYDRTNPTENIRMKQDDNTKKNKPKRKRIDVIIKNSPEGILYGNPCVEEETKQMGFKYTVQNPGLPGTLKPLTLMVHNLKVYTRLTLTKSPFWKAILKRRIRDCRERSGDWMG